MIANRAELADIFGCSLPTVDALVREGMPFIAKPVNSRGTWQFNTADCVNWKVERAEKKLGKTDKRADIDLRIAEAEATLKEMKVAEMQENLVPVEEIAAVFEQQLAIVKSRLNAMPARLDQVLALETDPREVRDRLVDEIDQALTDIHGFYIESIGKTVVPNIPDAVPVLAAPAPSEDDNYGY